MHAACARSCAGPGDVELRDGTEVSRARPAGVALGRAWRQQAHTNRGALTFSGSKGLGWCAQKLPALRPHMAGLPQL